MYPFRTVPPSQYKRDNFFPCINEEYRRCIRDDLCIRTQEEIDELMMEDRPEFNDDEPDPFNYEQPNYDPDVYDGEPIQKGDHLDVVSLLSGGCQDGLLIRCVNDNPYEFAQVGLKDSLKNKKYVLIVCVFAPSKWCQYIVSQNLCQLSILSSELLSSQPGDFEMVIVAKMRQDTSTGCDYDVDAFHQFFSAFPGRLAVPYSEAKIRDSVCAALGFDGELIKAILVGPDSTVLQDDTSFILDYGSIGFPFTDDRLETLAEEREKLSLSGLLGRDPSFRLHKFKPHEETESRSIEQLNMKLVGLYLFQRGDKLPLIHKVYNECRRRDKFKDIEPQFEIVMICMPLYVSTHPQVFQEEVFSVLNKEEYDISSWWVFPYDNSVCLRLWQLSKEHANAEDGMIIVGPHNTFFDPCGAHVIRHFGKSAYPFTRDVIVQRYVKRAKQVTLESLLLPYEPLAVNTKKIYASMTCVERGGGGEQVPLTELQGKNVLFYLNDAPICQSTLANLVDWYPKIKQVDPFFELVFVTCKDSDLDPGRIPESWLVRRCERDHLTYLMYNHEAFYQGYSGTKFFNGLGWCALVAFGKDGYIHSLDALLIRLTYGCNAFPFDPAFKDLRREIIGEISEEFYFMYGYDKKSGYSSSSEDFSSLEGFEIESGYSSSLEDSSL